MTTFTIEWTADPFGGADIALVHIYDAGELIEAIAIEWEVTAMLRPFIEEWAVPYRGECLVHPMSDCPYWLLPVIRCPH